MMFLPEMWAGIALIFFPEQRTGTNGSINKG
jgi:hypothetical protein